MRGPSSVTTTSSSIRAAEKPSRGRAVGLQREDHADLELHRLLHRVQPGDDRPLVQPEPEAVRELQAERLHLAAEAEVLGLGQQRGDLVGADAGLDAVDPAVHPLARLRVGVALRRGRAADREGAVVAGPVAVEGVDDVEERLVAGADEPVGEVVRVRVAPLAGDRVDRLDLVASPSRRAACWRSATISFSRTPGFSTSTMSW